MSAQPEEELHASLLCHSQLKAYRLVGKPSSSLDNSKVPSVAMKPLRIQPLLSSPVLPQSSPLPEPNLPSTPITQNLSCSSKCDKPSVCQPSVFASLLQDLAPSGGSAWSAFLRFGVGQLRHASGLNLEVALEVP